MSLSSMTGFARIEGGSDNAQWVLEARSVNGKGLDVRMRVPAGFDAVDTHLRKQIAQVISRGNIQVSISYEQTGAGQSVQLNQALFDAAYAIAKEQADTLGLAPPTIDGLLRLKGVLDVVEQSKIASALDDVQADVTKLCEGLVAARQDEGGRLAVMLGGHVDRIAELTDQARALATAQPQQIRDRLLKRLTDLKGEGFDEQRLAQEAVFLASKADITEELDRLDAHVSAARDLLGSSVPVGRKLDFLSQEFNREANTLCSKSADNAMTTIGLELKTTIEQLREQIQNVE